MPSLGAQDHLVAGLGAGHADELVPLVEAQGDDPAAQGPPERRQLGLLDRAAAGDHQQALVLAELADRDQAGDLLPLAELQQVDDRPAARGPGGHRQVVDLQPVDLAVVGEEEDVVVRQGDEHVLEEVAFLGVRGGDPPAAAVLGAVGAGREPLDVAVVGDGHHHVLLADQGLLVVVAQLLVGDHAAPRVGVLGLQLAHVGADQVEDQPLVGEDAPRSRRCRPSGPVYSATSLSASRPVSCWSRMARIASACIRVRLAAALASGSSRARRRISAETSRPISRARASAGLADERITRMISSM